MSLHRHYFDHARKRSRPHRRTGSVTLELILAAPVFAIFLIAVIQFGVFFANMQSVALACRVGASQASEDLTPTVAEVEAAVEEQLLSSNIQHCRIRLEYSTGDGASVMSSDTGSCTGCGPNSNLAAAPGGEDYVRVTVCVELKEVMPNLSSMFGFNVAGTPARFAECTTVLRHESL